MNMKITCPNPGCGAVYTVAAEHVGHRSVCKNCGTAFIIEATGARMVSAPGAGADLAAAAGAGAAGVAVAGMGAGPTQFSANVKQACSSFLLDPFTWLLAFGAFLVIIFMFQPIIDQFKAGRISAKIDRLEEKNRAEARRPSSSGDRSSGESSELKDLRDDLRDARISAQGARYFYGWGMMFGFLFLAIAEIGYLVSGTSKGKRVVGGILITAELLLIFIAYMVMSLTTTFR